MNPPDRLEQHNPVDQAHLRAIVAVINQEMSSMAAPSAVGLRASWAELIETLALSPAPDVRTCPSCGQVGMRLATVCGYCWTKLSPLSRDAAVPGTATIAPRGE